MDDKLNQPGVDPDLSLQDVLITAIRTSDIKGVRAALRRGADVNYWRLMDGERFPVPLGVALMAGDREIVRELLKAGANTNVEDYVRQCVEADDLHTLKLLLSFKADPNGQRTSKPAWKGDENFETNLIVAVREDRSAAMIRTLLDAGADPNRQDENEDSALLIARMQGNRRLVKLLEPCVSNTERKRVEELCGERCRVAVALDEKISEAINCGDSAEVKQLIVANNRNIDAFLHTGEGSLLEHAINRYYESLDPERLNPRDQQGRPIESEQVLAVITTLLDLSAPTDQVYYNAPLHIASRLCQHRPEVFERMVKMAEDVDPRQAIEFDTPLMNVAFFHVEKAVEILLSHGADVNALNRRGESPLTVAYRGEKLNGPSRVPQMLIDAGAKNPPPPPAP